jgi:hypothetical protein
MSKRKQDAVSNGKGKDVAVEEESSGDEVCNDFHN